MNYFLGAVSREGSPWYFPVALAVKTPLGLLLCAVVALFARMGRRIASVAGASLLLFLLLSSRTTYNIGVRHALLAFPLLAILAGAAAADPADRRPARLRRGAALGALLVTALEAATAHPHPFSFFNAFAGGADGGRRFFADSSLDWGQDLLRLRDLLARRGIPSSQVGIAYFGGDDPSLRIPGVADLLESDAPPRRYLAVSRHLLLLGPEAVLVGDTSGRAARSLALARASSSRRVARAGESLELFDLGGAGGTGEGAASTARRGP